MVIVVLLWVPHLPALPYPQEFEAQQLARVEAQLAASRAELSRAESSYGRLRDAFLAVHASLSPQALASAFGSHNRGGPGTAATAATADGGGPRFTLGAAQYAELSERLLNQRHVSVAGAGCHQAVIHRSHVTAAAVAPAAD